MAELHWFPLYVADWLTSTSITAMLPEQEGAYLRLLIQAWGDGSSEPRLEHDERKLAAWSRLGARWKKLGAAIVAEFELRDGFLYNTRLSEVWKEQQAKHAKASTKAKTAVTAREARRGAKRSQIDAQRERDGQHLQDDRRDHLQDHLQDDLTDDRDVIQSELDVVVEQPLTGLILPSTAPRRGLALEGAARSGASVADQAKDAEESRLHAEFYRWLREQFDAWIVLHLDDWAALKALLLRTYGAPVEYFRKPFDELPRYVQDNLIESVRAKNAWPDCEAWIEQRRRVA